MKYIINSTLVLILLFVNYSLSAQVPNGYYKNAEGKRGVELKTALFQTIKDPNVVSYSQLWKAFETTDSRRDKKVWDIYSANIGGSTRYEYNFTVDRCGQYKKEGDCYNREHIFPRSWFKGTKLMESDLFHIYPADGYVNTRRSNLPFGEVGITSWESVNGSKVGQNTSGDYTKTVFEPADEYKGDIARTYFYVVTAYEDDVIQWNSDQLSGNSYPAFSEWSLQLLLKWHHEDPVSLKEVRRNEEVYKLQGNRNPYIDYPELVEHIWGMKTAYEFTSDQYIDSYLSIEYSPFERWLEQQRWVENLKQYLKREK